MQPSRRVDRERLGRAPVRCGPEAARACAPRQSQTGTADAKEHWRLWLLTTVMLDTGAAESSFLGPAKLGPREPGPRCHHCHSHSAPGARSYRRCKILLSSATPQLARRHIALRPRSRTRARAHTVRAACLLFCRVSQSPRAVRWPPIDVNAAAMRADQPLILDQPVTSTPGLREEPFLL